MDALGTALALAAAVSTALTAGFFYAFAHTVMPGLGRTDDVTFLAGFQALDRQVPTPWFMGLFLGSPVLIGATALVLRDQRAVLAWTLAALVLYAITFVITATVHVPMNTALQALGGPGSMPDPGAVRAEFEPRWVRWNVVRTVTVVASLGCLLWALVLVGRG